VRPYQKTEQMGRAEGSKKQKLRAGQKHHTGVAGVCRRCGLRDATDRHHITGRVGPESENPENLIVLCRPCHTEIHAGGDVGVHRDATCPRQTCGLPLYRDSSASWRCAHGHYFQEEE